jgi:BirA family biotin operon repressor/biotin-[acetyl-CoA-carboxylase] ligase
VVGIHWPNDVFADGRKLAGILVEGLSHTRLVVGIGLNMNNSLAQAPQALRNKATTLLELTGTRHDRTHVLLAVLGKLAGGLRQLASAPEHLATRANALCLQHGHVLRIHSGRRCVRGRCAGIASDGALVLETCEGPQKFYSGVLR